VKAFVADASVAIAWVHPAQATAESDALLEAMAEGALLDVPALWPIEVANALTVLVRRRKLAAADRDTALGWFRGLAVRIDHEAASLAFSRLADLAMQYQVSIYDAAYLELAERRRLPLACLDGPLKKAAAAAGLPLWR
jgi:predicted nucleic acid-binding protein